MTQAQHMRQAGTGRSYYLAVVNTDTGKADLRSHLATDCDEAATMMERAAAGKENVTVICSSPRKAVAYAEVRKHNRQTRSGRCIRCNTDYTSDRACTCGARASLRDNRG